MRLQFIGKYLVSTVGMIMIIGPFFHGSMRSDGSAMGDAQMLSNMRYCTSAIIYDLHAIGGMALNFRKFLKLGGYITCAVLSALPIAQPHAGASHS